MLVISSKMDQGALKGSMESKKEKTHKLILPSSLPKPKDELHAPAAESHALEGDLIVLVGKWQWNLCPLPTWADSHYLSRYHLMVELVNLVGMGHF